MFQIIRIIISPSSSRSNEFEIMKYFSIISNLFNSYRACQKLTTLTLLLSYCESSFFLSSSGRECNHFKNKTISLFAVRIIAVSISRV